MRISAERIRHSLSLGAILLATWLLLSGYYYPLTISMGVLSCIFVVGVAARMDLIDHEGHPVHLTWRALTYFPWLTVEIVKANVDVVKRVLARDLPVSPTMVRLKSTQVSDVGKVIYANSITLTPGTISVDVANDEILVHALTREGAEALLDGEMDRRVTRMAGEDR